MSFGKGSGSQTVTTELTPEQRAQIQAQTEFFQQTIRPTYEQAVREAGAIFRGEEPGIRAAAQNLSGTAAQAQQVLGGTGESALLTGVGGLQSLFSPDYETRQIQAALAPAQAQYQQNLAGLQAGYGGAGQLGSARQALAQTQLAGTTAQQQAAAIADIQSRIQQQRAAAAESLAGIGQRGLGQAIGAAGTRVEAATTPMDLYQQYASVIFGTPSTSYMPSSFGGPASQTTSGRNFKFGVDL